MQKIATVYMLVNGAQTPFPLEEYYKMKATDKYIRKIRFVRIDDCLYEAPTDCFKAFHADAERKRREQARRKKAGKDGYRLIHYEALSSEGISGEERIEDPNCDVEETALLHFQICELRKALSKLSPEAYELIQAIHFKNKSLRKYAAKKGLTTFAILYRKKLHKLLENQREAVHEAKV